MLLSILEFGSLLSYSPRGPSMSEKRSKSFTLALKADEYVQPEADAPILMSDYICDIIKNDLSKLPFAGFITDKTILVPTPKSSLLKPNSLWVPQRLAQALVSRGLGKAAVECIERVNPVQKAATSQPSNRPTASIHYESFGVQKILSEPEEILLVDDVITRGATLLGAASRIKEAFPNAKVRALAIVRTISPPDIFKRTLDPCIGRIELLGTGVTKRRP
jgi:hypothetical protein